MAFIYIYIMKLAFIISFYLYSSQIVFPGYFCPVDHSDIDTSGTKLPLHSHSHNLFCNGMCEWPWEGRPTDWTTDRYKISRSTQGESYFLTDKILLI